MIKSFELEMVGFGFILCSPFSTSAIAEGEDYLESSFEKPALVEQQALDGKIVGVSTGTPGRFLFEVFEGYPPNENLDSYKYKLRLGVEVRDRTLQIRDLFDLMEWEANCPNEQKIDIDNGFYHITLLSNDPQSGIPGDNQSILVYLQKLNEMPQLNIQGVPTLC